MLTRNADATPVDLHVRRFAPVDRVVARLEVRARGRVRAGLDVRGDGSSEGYTGRLSKSVIEQRDGESPYAALRRTLEGT